MANTFRLLNNMKRINDSLVKLTKAEQRRRLKSLERQWIELNPEINAINYFYYRYFTNDFEKFLIGRMV